MDRRLYEHENGLEPGSYTNKRRPIQLVFCELFEDVNQAIAFEKQIKGWNRKKKEAIINGNWHLLPELSKRYT
jgi:putative endonuclease